MSPLRPTLAIFLIACGSALSGAPATSPPTTQPVPLVHVHAHNDYLHEHPLADALSHGFCSVEADIHLVNGELLVAHELKAVRPDKTLQSLYLDPLRARIKANGGRVYAGGPTVVLLIDVKTPFATTYPVLKGVLRGYEELLTNWTAGRRRDGAVLAIVTGDRQQAVIAADDPRLCSCDGDLADLDRNPPADLVPWISAPWQKSFQWKADGSPMPEAERGHLREIVTRVHAQHRQLRWWGSPDNVAFWTEIRSAEVDLINTDDLAGAERFLLSERQGGQKTKTEDGR
jgi:hypothetical protein